jgi:hypothetical protein
VLALIGVDAESACIVVRYAEYRRRPLPRHARAVAFGLQHVDDLLRTVVAEQLAQRLFVVRDAVAVDQRDEMLRCVA